MTPDCIAPEELHELVVLPDDDPRRRHAASCPRCGALLEEYRLYLAAEPPPELDLDRLERRLGERVAAEIGSPAVEKESPSARPIAPAGGFLGRLFHPAMRPAWALGAASVILVGILIVPDMLERADVVLRGDDESVDVPMVLDATIGPERLALRWRTVAAADGYRVRFESPGELQEIARQAVGRDTVLELARAGMPFRLAPGDTVVVRVEALAGGDVIAVSPARAIVTR
jgi:hypothetical protein